ncbi:MAG: hypothetical protein GX316_11130 [Firmicutes bacterium]|nr:hypothetical protein [Bacillota bacterium]
MASSKTTRVQLKRYYKVTKTSPEPLRPEDIHVAVEQSQTGSTGQNRGPNFIGLAVLWAHYKAYQEDLLTDTGQSPWDIPGCDDADADHFWLRFLRRIINDRDWVAWIQDPIEVKERVQAVLEEMTPEESPTVRSQCSDASYPTSEPDKTEKD